MCEGARATVHGKLVTVGDGGRGKSCLVKDQFQSHGRLFERYLDDLGRSWLCATQPGGRLASGGLCPTPGSTLY